MRWKGKVQEWCRWVWTGVEKWERWYKVAQRLNVIRGRGRAYAASSDSYDVGGISDEFGRWFCLNLLYR
jgi:hypothetical protein